MTNEAGETLVHVPEVWAVNRLGAHYHLIIKQPFGGCYDVVKVGSTGVTFFEELSELPAGAVRLVEEAEVMRRVAWIEKVAPTWLGAGTPETTPWLSEGDQGES